MKRFISIFFLTVILSGCATPADQTAMSLESTERGNYSAQSNLAGEVAVGSVIGGEKTNPAWTSEIGSEQFRRALENSLETAYLLGPRLNSKYLVDVELVGINQPMVGFSFNVSSRIRYTVREQNSRELVLDELVSADGRAGAGEAFVGTKRLQIATEKSAKNNIRNFIDRILEFAAKSSTED